MIKEVIAVSQAEWNLEPVKKVHSNCTQEVHFFPSVHGSWSISDARSESDCN